MSSNSKYSSTLINIVLMVTYCRGLDLIMSYQFSLIKQESSDNQYFCMIYHITLHASLLHFFNSI